MAKQKKEGKLPKGRAGIFVGILIALLIAASIVLACTVFFRVEAVVVEGNERYSQEEILTAAAVEKGANLPLTPKEQIVQRIRKSLPYVDDVTVQKRLPTTIKLIVTEARPVAVIAAGEEMWIIDAKGRLLEQADEAAAQEYIQVMGLEIQNPVQGELAQVGEENQGQLKSLLALLTALQEKEMVSQVSKIDAASKTEIILLYQNRLRVKILNNADFSRKMEILRVIEASMETSVRGVVDLKTERPCFSPE